MKKCRYYTIVFVVLMAMVLSSCAVNQSYSLLGARPDLQTEGNGQVISVLTQDQREYIVSGRNHPWTAGIMRGGWGNPFYVSIKDQKPLADEMNTVLVNALQEKGYRPTPILLSANDSSDKIVQEMQAGNASVGILLTVKEWKPDLGSGGRLGLTYDLKMSPVNRNGIALASIEEEGHKQIGVIRGFSQIIERFEEYTATAFQQEIESMLNNPDIARHLR